MAEKILVVDDEHEITDLISLYLQNENYTVFKFYDPQEALACIENSELDLAILDIMLPGMSGFTLCQKIRENHVYPVIMLTARDQETDKITGLTLGADDYITKPFRPLELVARVKAQLRRYKKYDRKAHSEPVMLHAGLEMHMDSHTCLLNGKPITLTPTEFSILWILLERKGRVVSSEELFHDLEGRVLQQEQ